MKMLKKKEKTIGKNKGISDEYFPCICGHEKKKHWAPGEVTNSLCWGCYQNKEPWFHPFKLDNLTLVEKLYVKKELKKYKKER